MTLFRQALCPPSRFALLSCVALLALMVCARAEDAVGTRLAAAERYIHVVDVQAMTENLLAGMVQKFPIEKRDALLKRFSREVRRSRLESILVNAMVQVYGSDELNAAADFYSSPQGQAILRKSSQFINAAMPAMEAEMDRILQAMGGKISRGMAR